MTKFSMKLCAFGAVSALVLTATAAATWAQQAPAPAAPAAATPPLPTALAAYDKAGSVKTVKNAEGPDCTVFRPETLSAKTPVIVWSNGNRQTPDKYATMLDQLASNGFVVAAANSGNAGTGAEPLACLDYLTTQNTTAGSPYMGKLDLTKVGAAGHSQGGGGTLMAARDARIKAIAPIMPYTRAGLGFDPASIPLQKGPVLLMSGGADTIAPPEAMHKPVYDALTVPVFWANVAGQAHT
ncbi:MAG: alpha/beta hydrolase, partial [Alphaproteobacteria bacterium]